jgi:aryl-alcohol dehydrogenase-like predicted oxidoreductase
MMFGAWGNPDHDDAVRIIHRASTRASTSSTPPTSTRRGESEAIVCKALAAAGATHVVLATKVGCRWAATPTAAALATLDHRGGRGLAATAAGTDWIDLYQVHRLDPASTSTRPRRALGSRPCGQDPRVRRVHGRGVGIVEAQWVAERRGRERCAPSSRRTRS